MSIHSNEDTAYYRSALEFVLGVPFTDGNSVEPLQNGDAIFPAMFAAIDAAATSIDFETFVYWEGDVAQQCAEKLADRAKAGVRVRVLLDAFGSKRIHRELVDMMIDSGVELRWFRPLSTWRIWRSDKRTHRKILVCDGAVAFTGGVGIADEWTGNARGKGEWRDTHFRVTGPVVNGLFAAFMDNWNEAGEWTFERHPNAVVEQPGDVAIQVIRSSATIGWTDISTLVRALISVAKYRITIVTAYFTPDSTLVKMLCEAVDRGIDVTVLMTGNETDSRLSQLAGQRTYENLLEGGVQLYRYQKTMLHMKSLMIDDSVACLGSANINHRSLSKDEECCMVTLSTSLNQNLMATFEEDLKGAEKLELEHWKQRGLSEKIQEFFAGLLIEQL